MDTKIFNDFMKNYFIKTKYTLIIIILLLIISIKLISNIGKVIRNLEKEPENENKFIFTNVAAIIIEFENEHIPNKSIPLLKPSLVRITILNNKYSSGESKFIYIKQLSKGNYNGGVR